MINVNEPAVVASTVFVMLQKIVLSALVYWTEAGAVVPSCVWRTKLVTVTLCSTTVVPPSRISSVWAATICAPELDVPTSYPMSPVPITGAVSQNILMSVMIVFAGCVNSPIAGLSPAVVLTVTPVAKPTCFTYLLVTIPVEAMTAVSVYAPVVEFLETTLNPFSERTGPEMLY